MSTPKETINLTEDSSPLDGMPNSAVSAVPADVVPGAKQLSADVVPGAKQLSNDEQQSLERREKSFQDSPSSPTDDTAETSKLINASKQLVNYKYKIVGFFKSPVKGGIFAGAGLATGALLIFAIPFVGVAEVMSLGKDIEFMTADTSRHNSNMLKRLYYYVRTGDVGKTRLGTLGNINQARYDADLAKSGITLKSTASGGSFTYEIDFTKGQGGLKESEAKAMAKDAHEALKREGITTSYTEGSTKVEVNGKTSIFNNKEAVRIHRYMIDDFTNKGKIITALTLRNAGVRTGMPSWNILARADAKFRSNTYGKIWDEMKKRTQSQPKKFVTIAPTDNPENDPDIARANEEDLPKLNNGVEEVKKARAIPRTGSSVALAGVGAICIVKHTVNSVDTANEIQNRSVSIKLAQSVLVMMSQIMAGENVDMSGIGEYVELFRQSKEYKKELEAQGKPLPDNSRLQNYIRSEGQNTAGYTLDASKSPNPEQSELAKLLNNDAFSTVCGVLENPVVGIISFAYAPFTSAATFLALGAIEPLLVDYLTNDVIDITKPENRGPVNKELNYAGAHLIANENAYGIGGNDMSESQIQTYYNEFYNDYALNQNLFNKYFDLTNSRSVAGVVAKNVYTDKLALLSNPSTILKNISSITLAKPAKAWNPYNQEVFYKLPFTRLAPEVTKYENPYEVATEAQKIFTGPEANKYKELVKKCHRLKVVNEATELDFKNDVKEPGLTDESQLPKECNENTDEKLNIIRAAIWATTTMKADICYNDTTEIGKEACKDIGVEGGAQPSASGEVVSGDKAELIDKILANPKIKLNNNQAGFEAEIKANLQIGALKGLASMGEKSGVDFTVTDLYRPGASDFHGQGQAIDIGYWGNGQSQWVKEGDQLYKYLYDNREALKVNELIWWKPPEGYSNLDEGKPHTFDDGLNQQHIHHIHVSFDNP